ncbi:MAG: YfiR family protein [Candidatus Hydrogenedentota bacterium]
MSALLITTQWTPAFAQSESRDIDEVKAAFVLKFVRFVEWPEGAFETPDSPLRIGIAGNRKVYDALSELAAAEADHGRKFEVIYSEDGRELGTCQIAYFGRELAGTVTAALGRLGEASVLTIGDSDEFTSSGGVIRLYEKSRKMSMEINVSAAERAELKISSKLLELATVVRDKNA